MVRVAASEVEVGVGGSQRGAGQWHSQVVGRRLEGNPGGEGSPGQGGTAAGQGGTAAGRGGTAAGRGGTAAGREGTAAGGAVTEGEGPGSGPGRDGKVDAF